MLILNMENYLSETVRIIGMKGIWKKGFQWNDVQADFMVDDLSELPLIIEKLIKQNVES